MLYIQNKSTSGNKKKRKYLVFWNSNLSPCPSESTISTDPGLWDLNLSLHLSQSIYTWRIVKEFCQIVNRSFILLNHRINFKFKWQVNNICTERKKWNLLANRKVTVILIITSALGTIRNSNPEKRRIIGNPHNRWRYPDERFSKVREWHAVEYRKYAIIIIYNICN